MVAGGGRLNSVKLAGGGVGLGFETGRIRVLEFGKFLLIVQVMK